MVTKEAQRQRIAGEIRVHPCSSEVQIPVRTRAFTVPNSRFVAPPAGRTVYRPTAAGTMKVSLDNQEVREYQLLPDQSLNWKVSASLAVELSAPGLARIWVDQQEIAVAEQSVFILKSAVKPGGRP